MMSTTVKEQPPVYIQGENSEKVVPVETQSYEFRIVLPLITFPVEMTDAQVISAASECKTFAFLDSLEEDIYSIDKD